GASPDAHLERMYREVQLPISDYQPAPKELQDLDPATAFALSPAGVWDFQQQRSALGNPDPMPVVPDHLDQQPGKTPTSILWHNCSLPECVAELPEASLCV